MIRKIVDITAHTNGKEASMKLRLAITLLVPLGFAVGFCNGWHLPAQRHEVNALVLRGRVIGVKTEIPPERIVAIVTVNLSLEFSNNGPKPIILLTELAPLLVGRAITKTPEVPANWLSPEKDNILFMSYRGWSDFGAGRWEVLRVSLDKQKPPIDKVLILAPGESWTKEAFIELRPRIESEKYPVADKALGDLEMLSPVWLYLYCQTWPPNIEVRGGADGLKTGTKLRKRWMEFGELRLDPIASEPISFEFPKQHINLPTVEKENK
jgi:hypothetical protein